MSLSFIKEYHEGNNNLEITPTDPKEAIYIYKCVKSTIRVHGKLNSIVIGQFYMYYTFYLYIQYTRTHTTEHVHISLTGMCAQSTHSASH